MITTTGFGKTVSSHSELVSTGVGLPPRDTPSSSLFSTDDEVACLTGVKEPNYVRPVPLHSPLAPHPPPVLGHIDQVVLLLHVSQNGRILHLRHSVL